MFESFRYNITDKRVILENDFPKKYTDYILLSVSLSFLLPLLIFIILVIPEALATLLMFSTLGGILSGLIKLYLLLVAGIFVFIVIYFIRE
ncbi:MAG: hypothetical protein ACTSX9_05105 [Candidatus Njordarchaeales archaeon]